MPSLIVLPLGAVLPVPAPVATLFLPIGALQGITQGALLGLFMMMAGLTALRTTDEEWVSGVRGAGR